MRGKGGGSEKGALLERDIPKGCWAGPQGEGGQAVPGHTCCGQQCQASGAGWEGDRPELGLVVLQEGMEGKYTHPQGEPLLSLGL